MVGLGSGAILRPMQALLGAGTFGGLSDGELLERFLARRDAAAELAFAVLVERHGPMVLGVCRRILRDPHDAEDAFQATFLVLARKGRSVRVEGSLGRWLFGVASRVAARARSDRRRRRDRERSGMARLEVGAFDASLVGPDRAEIRAAVAAEIAGLPSRYQAAVLLCDLEGASHEEAARRLGWPVGTVKSRLSRARARLRERLSRRGLAPDGASLAIVMFPAAPARGLVQATTRTAIALGPGRLATAGVVSASVANLTQGVLRTMMFTRIKLAAASLLLVAVGSAALLGQTPPEKPMRLVDGQLPADTSAIAPVARSEDQADLEMLERAWADAVARRDTVVIDRILADDFEGTDQVGGPFARASYLAEVAHGRLATDNRLVDARVRIFGAVGVVICRIQSPSSGLSRRDTKVYARRGARWRCVAWHEGIFHGTGSGAAAREGWRKALKGWESSGSRADLENKANCASCHTPAVFHEDPLRQPAVAEPAPPVGPVTVVRPPFECRVVAIRVHVGEAVKKGGPLLELFSADLAAAKVAYEVALSQWHREERNRDEKRALVESNLLTKQSLMNAENDETRSRLQMKVARDRLLMYGLRDEDIANIGKESDGDRARFTLRAPDDGAVVAVGAVLGSYYDRKDDLIRIRAVPDRGRQRR